MLAGRSLGDVVYGLSCMEDFRREHPGDRIEVAADLRYRELVEGYGFDGYHFLEPGGREYRNVEALLMTKKYAREAYRRRIVCTVPMIIDPYARKSGQTALALVRRMFGLAESGRITYPSLPAGPVLSIPEFEANRKRIAVINPYSASLACSEFGIFEKIAEFLKEQGYLVYTNVVGKQKEIRGTNRLECSIGEFYRIASKIPLVVSIRSGILDYIIGSGANLFAIYLFQYRHLKKHMETMHLFAKMFDLSAWQTGNYRQCIYEGEEQTMEEFLAYFGEINS